MARQLRLIQADQVHMVWQCGLGVPSLFQDDTDCLHFLSLLRRWAPAFGVDVHAFVLLPEQVVLLVTPHLLPVLNIDNPAPLCGLSTLMQALGRDHVAAFNRRHGRKGTLWQGRFRAAPVDAATHWRACVQYIEQAPLRQALAPQSWLYPWSSACHHVGQQRCVGLTEHAGYWALGNTPFERQAAHRLLLEEPLSPKELTQIESIPRQGWPWGSDGFLQALERRLDGARRISRAAPGRPRKVRLGI